MMSIEDHDVAEFRLTHLCSDEVIDRIRTTYDRIATLNAELQAHDSLYRWTMTTDTPAAALGS